MLTGKKSVCAHPLDSFMHSVILSLKRHQTRYLCLGEVPLNNIFVTFYFERWNSHVFTENVSLDALCMKDLKLFPQSLAPTCVVDTLSISNIILNNGRSN